MEDWPWSKRAEIHTTTSGTVLRGLVSLDPLERALAAAELSDSQLAVLFDERHWQIRFRALRHTGRRAIEWALVDELRRIKVGETRLNVILSAPTRELARHRLLTAPAGAPAKQRPYRRRVS